MDPYKGRVCAASPLNKTDNHSLTNHSSLNDIIPLPNSSSSYHSHSNTSNFSHIFSGNYSPFPMAMVVLISCLIFLYTRYYPQRTRTIVYKLKVFLSSHPIAKPVILFFATLLLIIFGALLLFMAGNATLGDALWLSTFIVADALNLNSLIGTASRGVSMTIRSAGLFIYACLLGMVSEAISSLFDSLRKGKSEVMEINHTLILGWSEKLGSLLQQLALENRSDGGGVIVVLAERDKEEMEADIAKLECDYLGSSVTCRSGNPLILGDLQKVAVSNARAIIILASHENAEQSDAAALRIVICLTGLIGLTGCIVVEINDPKKERIFQFVGGDLIKTVVVPNVTGRLMVRCALQPGLAKIWHDILGSGNQKFSLISSKGLIGCPWNHVLFSFPRAIPLGVKVAVAYGKILLNPNDSYVLKDGDEIVVIADNVDDDIDVVEIQPPNVTFLMPHQARQDPKMILFCGWRPHIHDMISVLNSLVPEGSELWLFNELEERESRSRLIADGLNLSNLGNLKLVYMVGSAVNRKHLETLPLELFHSIFILADNSFNDSIVHTDSRSLTTFLLIREIKSDRYATTSINPCLITTEILDVNTRNMVLLSPNLATFSSDYALPNELSSDYVLPNEWVTRMLAVMTKNRDINGVFEDVFANEEHGLYIRPAYLYLGNRYEPVSFNQIMANARLRQEIVIGYREPGSNQFIINPPNKQRAIKWCNFQLPDVDLVVISRK